MSTEPKTASYGRPRLLTHEEILDGAVELGLENVTMKKLSTHLGVGTATLYQYFDSRKALMRAAAVHSLSDVHLPEDTGQHWTEFARDYVLSLMELLADNPSYINSMSPTEYGFEVHFNIVEPFLSTLNRRGISPTDGIRLFNQIGIIAYGAAVESVRQQEFEFQDETMDVVARRQFGRLDEKDFPLMAQVLDAFTHTPEQKTALLMRSVFRTFAHEIGEDISDYLNEEA